MPCAYIAEVCNMKKCFVNELPQLVLQKKVTKKEACRQLWIWLYLYPSYFGLNGMDEDEKSNFLLHVQPKFETALQNYRIGKSSFRTYFSTFIRFQYANWLHKKSRQKLIDSLLLTQFHDQETEKAETDELYAYSEKEKNLQIAERSSKKLTPNQKTVLILAMRNYRFLTPRLQLRISDYTGISQEELRQILERARLFSAAKEDRIEKFKIARNRQYILHLQYQHILSKMERNATGRERIEKSYKAHTEKWRSLNKKLSGRLLVNTSTELIARELQLTIRMIYFYLSRAKDITETSIAMDEEKKIHYDTFHETLSSKRQ